MTITSRHLLFALAVGIAVVVELAHWQPIMEALR
jgi:hypothetical protein